MYISIPTDRCGGPPKKLPSPLPAELGGDSMRLVRRRQKTQPQATRQAGTPTVTSTRIALPAASQKSAQRKMETIVFRAM